jgi:cytochrome c oxidase cbb3-type subunit III
MHLAIPLALLMAAQAPMGEAIFTGQCAICHGQRGEGGRGPALARSKLRHAPDDAALQRIIRRGIPGTGMPGTWLNEAELAGVAAHVRSLGRTGAAPASLAGNATSGEAVFRGKGRCAACHTVNGHGGAFGPDLTGIGARRSAVHLRQSVVEPAADVLPDFVLLHAVTQTGRTVTGARVNEDTFSVQIRDAAGVVHSFWKSELRQLRKEPGKTAMPGYGAALSASELDDLVRYLASLEEAQ